MVVCHVTPASRLALDVVCRAWPSVLAALADDWSAVAVRPASAIGEPNRGVSNYRPVRCRTVDRPVVLGTDRSGRNGGSLGLSRRLAATASVVVSVLVAVLTWWFHRQCPPVAAGVMVSTWEPSLCLLRWCVRYGHWRRRGGDPDPVDLPADPPPPVGWLRLLGRESQVQRARKAMGSALTAAATVLSCPVGLFGGKPSADKCQTVSAPMSDIPAGTDQSRKCHPVPEGWERSTKQGQ